MRLRSLHRPRFLAEAPGQLQAFVIVERRPSLLVGQVGVSVSGEPPRQHARTSRARPLVHVGIIPYNPVRDQLSVNPENVMSQPDATTARNTELALAFLNAADRQDFAAAEACLSPDFHLHFSGQTLDRDATMALIRSVYASFADFQHELQEAFAVDDRVILRLIDRATHTGEFEGVQATGRTIAVGQISLFRIAGGQIVEIREEADLLGLMQQIGAIPAHAS